MSALLKRIVHPRALISVLLGIAILVGLLLVSGVQRAFTLIVAFQPVYLLYFVALMLVYTTLRCVIWHRLLVALELRFPLAEQVYTFLVGEVTKVLPIGNYVPDYLLQRFEGADIGLTSAATTLMVLIEVAVSLAGLVVLGVDGWSWLRPVIVVGVAVFGLLLWIVVAWERAPHHLRHRHAWVTRLTEHRMVRMALGKVKTFGQGSRSLLHARVLLPVLALGAVYLVGAGGMLYVLVLGLGIHSVNFAQVLSVFFFSLAFSLIVPIPVDFGVTEASGVGAFVAFGVSTSVAVSVLLLSRVLILSVNIVIVLGAMGVLRDDLRAMRRRRRRNPAAPQPATSPEHASGT